MYVYMNLRTPYSCGAWKELRFFGVTGLHARKCLVVVFSAHLYKYNTG